MKVKEESEIFGLKLNIQKTTIIASGPILRAGFVCVCPGLVRQKPGPGSGDLCCVCVCVCVCVFACGVCGVFAHGFFWGGYIYGIE